MPRAKIVVEKTQPRITLDALVREEIVKLTIVNGIKVYSRFYLTSQQVRRACEKVRKK